MILSMISKKSRLQTRFAHVGIGSWILVTLTLLYGAVLSYCQASGSAKPETAYEVVDIGTELQPWAINNRGEVAGTHRGGRTFFWSAGKVTSIPALKGDSYCEPHAINDAGQVLVCSVNGDGTRHAFIWKDGNITQIHPPAGFDTISVTALGPNGEVVGTVDRLAARNLLPVFSGDCRAFLYKNGVVSLLPSMNGKGSEANAINAKGQIAGSDTAKGGHSEYAALWEKGVVKVVKAPKSVRNVAYCINGSGQIAGTSSLSPFDAGPESQNFLSFNGEYQTIKAPEQFAGNVVRGLNDSGQVLMSSRNRHGELGGGTPTCWIWQAGKVTELNDIVLSLGWRSFSAGGLNNKGAVVGTAVHDGERHAIILVPK